MITKTRDVTMVCPAPYPRPSAIARNKYTNSSGSLIGVRKRITDNAPTRPRDKAKEDLTTIITMAGKGSRFQKEGYKKPKPLIEVSQEPMILRSLAGDVLA